MLAQECPLPAAAMVGEVVERPADGDRVHEGENAEQHPELRRRLTNRISPSASNPYSTSFDAPMKAALPETADESSSQTANAAPSR